MLAQEVVTITDQDLNGNQTYTFTNNNIYLLDGLVYLEAGGVLNIEAGTIIKAKSSPSTLDDASALIITRGAQIFAVGSATLPIIFTSDADDLGCSLDQSDRGLWAGLFILGAAPFTFLDFEEYCPSGLSCADPRNKFGGENMADNSGILQYVSIRHAGAELAFGADVAGLTLAGVGNVTQMDYIEVFAGASYGVTLWGGNVAIKHLSSTFCWRGASNSDMGWQGKGQFWLALQEDGQGAQHEGTAPDEAMPSSNPIIYNATYIGNPENLLDVKLLVFQDGSRGTYGNSIITGIRPFGVTVEDTNEEIDCIYYLEQGELNFINNIWYSVDTVTNWGQVFSATSFPGSTLVTEHLNNNENELTEPLLQNICFSVNSCFNPLLQENSPALNNIAPVPNDGFFETTHFRGAFDEGNNWCLGWTALDAYGFFEEQDMDCAVLSGTVYWDNHENCETDAGEATLSKWKIHVWNETIDYYDNADDNGGFNLQLSPGNYNVQAIPPNPYWETCPFQVVSLSEGQSLTLDLWGQVFIECPYLSVDICTPFLRRCFSNNYEVSYCNTGTISATAATVEVSLDSFLILEEASVPYSNPAENLYIFEVGDIEVGECSSFSFQVMVSCDAELGQTHCVEAHIFPDDNCLDENPTPLIEVSGNCEEEQEVIFSLKNIGLPMEEPAYFLVIEDDVMLLQQPFQLNQEETLQVPLEANGSTYQLFAPKVPGNLDKGYATAGVEGCGENAMGTFSMGFISAFPEGDNEPYLAKNCRSNIGSYDPNDKQSFPKGFGEDQLIWQNVDVEYLIRFQNTGTDTAFTVRIEDQLPKELELASFEPGASSHPYTWDLTEDGFVVFHFEDIMLPDSNVNEAASHGFVQFRMAQNKDLAVGTLIENYVDIFFDFNEPVRTNTTFLTVSKNEIEDLNTANSEPELIEQVVLVYPNPMSDKATFELIGLKAAKGKIQFYNLMGQMVFAQYFQEPVFSFNSKMMKTGMYFYDIQIDGRLIKSGKLMVQ